MDYIFVVSEHLDGLDLLTSCAVCVGWRTALLTDWEQWRRRLRDDYGMTKRTRDARSHTLLSWRDSYIMKVNGEAREARSHYYIFYFSMYHAWYDEELGKRRSELRKEHLIAFCKKRRGLRIMKRAFKRYLNMEGGTYDDSAWQGQEMEQMQFPSFRAQFGVRKGKKVPIDIGGVLVRY
jgi:hypothetical protein